jgi:hypothetical protein
MKLMKRITKFILNLTSVGSIVLIATLSPSQFAVMKGVSRPSVEGEPGSTEAGGPRFIQPREDMDASPPTIKRNVRGCNANVTALMPENKIGRTVFDYPTFFFYLYLPKTEETEETEKTEETEAETRVKLAEFILKDESGKQIYQQNLTISNLSGVIGVSIPADKNVPPLEVGKKYTWTFTLICNPEDRSGDKIESGVVRRVELSADILGELEKADLRQKTVIYAREGIWQDAVSNLAAARRANPNDTNLAADWKSLLDSVKLDQIAKEPLLEMEAQP